MPSQTSKKGQSLFKNTIPTFKKFAVPTLALRKKLREKIRAGKLNPSEARMVLQAWMKQEHTHDLHGDVLPDWITGADISMEKPNDFLDPASGHQIGYGATPLSVMRDSLASLPLQKGDSVLDVGSGFGRIVMSGAIVHPELTFTGVEYVAERAQIVQEQIQKLKIPNAQSLTGDASTVEIESHLEKAKGIFLFNSFSEPALELFLERTKNVVRRSGQKKYLVTVNEHLFPFSLKSKGFKVYKKSVGSTDFNQFTVYEISP